MWSDFFSVEHKLSTINTIVNHTMVQKANVNVFCFVFSQENGKLDEPTSPLRNAPHMGRLMKSGCGFKKVKIIIHDSIQFLFVEIQTKYDN